MSKSKLFTLPYNVRLQVTTFDGKRTGEILTSSIEEEATLCIDQSYKKAHADVIHAFVNSIHALLVAHAEARMNITSKKYLRGIEAAVDQFASTL